MPQFSFALATKVSDSEYPICLKYPLNANSILFPKVYRLNAFTDVNFFSLSYCFFDGLRFNTFPASFTFFAKGRDLLIPLASQSRQ